MSGTVAVFAGTNGHGVAVTTQIDFGQTVVGVDTVQCLSTSYPTIGTVPLVYNGPTGGYGCTGSIRSLWGHDCQVLAIVRQRHGGTKAFVANFAGNALTELLSIASANVVAAYTDLIVQ